MDSSKMISEQLFLLIPMLYNQIIRPIEGALRAKISPLQFYALMALKREGCMTMSALSAHCGVSKQQSTRLINSLADTGLVERRPCKQDRRLIFICLSAYGEAQMDKLRAAVCRGIEDHLSILTQGEQKELLFSLETVWKIRKRRKSKIIGFPSFQHSILSQPVLSPAKRKGRRAGFRTVFPQLFQWERLKCLRRRAALEWHAYEY